MIVDGDHDYPNIKPSGLTLKQAIGKSASEWTATVSVPRSVIFGEPTPAGANPMTESTATTPRTYSDAIEQLTQWAQSKATEGRRVTYGMRREGIEQGVVRCWCHMDDGRQSRTWVKELEYEPHASDLTHGDMKVQHYPAKGEDGLHQAIEQMQAMMRDQGEVMRGKRGEDVVNAAKERANADAALGAKFAELKTRRQRDGTPTRGKPWSSAIRFDHDDSPLPTYSEAMEAAQTWLWSEAGRFRECDVTTRITMQPRSFMDREGVLECWLSAYDGHASCSRTSEIAYRRRGGDPHPDDMHEFMSIPATKPKRTIWQRLRTWSNW